MEKTSGNKRKKDFLRGQQFLTATRCHLTAEKRNPPQIFAGHVGCG